MKADSPRLVQEEKAESNEGSEKTPVPDVNGGKDYEEQSFGEDKGDNALK